MKKILLPFVLLLGVLMLPATAYAQDIYGDVNGDQEVTIADVNKAIDVILGGGSNPAADVNNDDEVTIADVNAIIDIILGGGSPVPSPEWVDLGLPSGTLWATRNVGANAPEEYGDYFAWGEIAPKDAYSWSTYKWCDGNQYAITKYDPLWYEDPELEPEDDAAFVNCGPNWRIPSDAQIEELCNSCSWQWTTVNGVNGQLGTGPNGKTIFLPAAGRHSGSSLSNEGKSGEFWSRTVAYSMYTNAYYLRIVSGGASPSLCGRNYGLTVRAVRVSPADEQPLLIVGNSLDLGKVPIDETCTGELTLINHINESVTVTVNADDPFVLEDGDDWIPSIDVVVPGNSVANVTVIFTAETPGDFNSNVTFMSPALDGGQSVIPVHAQAITDDFEEHEYIDLGLPSHTLWATCNIGANAPEERGDCFAWGETSPKDYYAWSTYKWFANGANLSGFTKYCCDSPDGYNGFADGKKELDPVDDAAFVNWGPNWRMPSDDQIDELNEKCTWQWKQRNGVNGYLVTGPNGKSMFLPVTGFCVGSSRVSGGNGEYWSRTLLTEYGNYSNYRACNISFYDENWYWFCTSRFNGLPVRAVFAPQN